LSEDQKTTTLGCGYLFPPCFVRFLAAVFLRAFFITLNFFVGEKMERETRKKIFSKYRQTIARVVWAGISVGALSFIFTNTSESGFERQNKGMVTPSPQTVSRHFEENVLTVLTNKEEKFQQPSPTPTPPPTETPVPTLEWSATPIIVNQQSSSGIRGRATYYGVDDGYGLEDTLGCTGEPFDPFDPTTAARPYSSPFNCGDTVRICDNDSCIEVVIKDTCPGCDANGLLLDLSYGAMVELTGQAATADVTIEGPLND